VATSEDSDFSSRQMIVCGESGHSMMLKSVGEQNVSSGVPPVASVRVVRRGGLRLTVVLDRSQSEERYSVSRKALYNLVSSLPTGTMLAFIIYTDTARIALQHTKVTEDNIDGLFGRIPGRNVNQKKPCLDCALKLALGLNSSKVLVLSGEVSEFSVSKEVAKMAEEEQVAVHLVAGEVAPSAEVEKLLLKGGLHLTQSLTGGRLLSRMRRTLQEVIGGERQTIYSSEHRFTGGAVGGSLTVENCRTDSLRVEVITDHMVDIEMFELQDPQGNKHQFPTYQHGVVFFQLKEAVIGAWNYKIKMFGTTSQETPLLVQASAKSSCQDSVSVKKVWTNVGVSGTSARNPPLVIYTHLSQNSQEDLSVTALLRRPGSSSILEIELRDPGTGYPDISSGDGIYSAYFTDFTTEPGYYSVSIRVSSPSVSLLHTGTQFYITEGIQHYIRDGVPQVRDIFPPSRIMDLVGHNAGNNTLYATLQWTAPGGDYNTGHSHHYEVRCSTHPAQLSNQNFSKEGLSVQETLIPVPQHAGTPQSMTVALPWPNNKFYYAVLAVDQEGNYSPVSNLVQITAPPIESAMKELQTEEQHDLPINLPVIFSGDFTNSSAIYIISGAVCGVLLILSAIATAILLRRRISSTSSKIESYGSNNLTISYPTSSKLAELPDIAVGPKQTPDDFYSNYKPQSNISQYHTDTEQQQYMPGVFTRESLGSDPGSSSTSSTEYSAEELYSNSITVSLSSRFAPKSPRSQNARSQDTDNENMCINPVYSTLDSEGRFCVDEQPGYGIQQGYWDQQGKGMGGHVYENYCRPQPTDEDDSEDKRPRQESLV